MTFSFQDSAEFYRGPKNGDLTGKVNLTRWISGGPKDCGFDYDFTSPCGIQGPIYLLYENQTWSPLAADSQIIYLDENTAIHPKDITDKGPGLGDSQWDSRAMGQRLSAKAVDFILDAGQNDRPFLFVLLFTNGSPSTLSPRIF